MGVKRGQIVDPILESYEEKLKDSMKTLAEARKRIKELNKELVEHRTQVVEDDIETTYLKEKYVERCVEGMDMKTLHQTASDLLLSEIEDVTLGGIIDKIREFGWEDLLQEKKRHYPFGWEDLLQEEE